MNEYLDKIVFLLFGGVVALVVQQIFYKLHEKTKIIKVRQIAFQGLPDSHMFFFDGLTKDMWEKAIPSEIRDNCITVIYFLMSAGRGVIKDLKITLETKNNGDIASYQFQVDRQIICERLSESKPSPSRLEAVWQYVNPGEVIDLHALVSGTTNPEDIELGVDGEGVQVKKGAFLTRCVLASVTAKANITGA